MALKECSVMSKIKLTEDQGDQETKDDHPCGLYRVQEMPGKGLSLVATRTLEAGDVLFSEEPLLVVDKGEEPVDINNQAISNQVYQAFSKLTDKGLACHEKYGENVTKGEESKTKPLGVFLTNRIGCGSNKSGLYANLSRTNHSCAPNASWGGVEDDANGTRPYIVQVVRKIEEGEEICASYCNLKDFPKKEERRQRLLHWSLQGVRAHRQGARGE